MRKIGSVLTSVLLVISLTACGIRGTDTTSFATRKKERAQQVASETATRKPILPAAYGMSSLRSSPLLAMTFLYQ